MCFHPVDMNNLWFFWAWSPCLDMDLWKVFPAHATVRCKIKNGLWCVKLKLWPVSTVQSKTTLVIQTTGIKAFQQIFMMMGFFVFTVTRCKDATTSSFSVKLRKVNLSGKTERKKRKKKHEDWLLISFLKSRLSTDQNVQSPSTPSEETSQLLACCCLQIWKRAGLCPSAPEVLWHACNKKKKTDVHQMSVAVSYYCCNYVFQLCIK